MNDSRQMMVNLWGDIIFEGRHTATINKNNHKFSFLAECFGIQVFKCETKYEMYDVTRDFLTYPGPALCEYVVEPEMCLPLVGPGKALDDMILFGEFEKDEIEYDKSSVPS